MPPPFSFGFLRRLLLFGGGGGGGGGGALAQLPDQRLPPRHLRKDATPNRKPEALNPKP